jgi:hypothetical protein
VSGHRELVLQCSAPSLASTMICLGSFDDVAAEPNHLRILCPTETSRERSRSGGVFGEG